MNKTKTWTDIPGYEGLYRISTSGQVYSYPRRGNFGREHHLKFRIDKGGYLRVLLSKNNKSKELLVHRLVAQTFLPNPDNLPEVNHKDENPKNNDISNLEWCTSKYNSNYGTRNERMAKTLTNGPCSKKVAQYSLDDNLIKIWPSTMECSRNGFDFRNVSACCREERPKAYGYKWSYLNEEGDEICSN